MNKLFKTISFKKIISCFLLAALLNLLFLSYQTPVLVHAQDDSQAAQLLKQIQDLQSKIDNAQAQEKTLQNQLDYIDNQTKLTELKIEQAKYQIGLLNSQITDLDGRIGRLSTTVDQMTNVLLNRIITTYKYSSNISPIELIFSSHNFAELLERIKYLQVVQANDKKVLYQLQATKTDYNDQKNDKETRQAQEEKLQKDLQNYQTQLVSQKREKQDLLTETQGNEQTYQKLLAQAKAQLASLAGFADSRSGGTPSIIPHQDLSDSWGKYYNQRDANWGKNFIGLSTEQIWEVGCLITSFAMVATHFGENISPADVAANTDNFSLGTAFFKIPGPQAGGHSSEYVTNPSMDYLRSEVEAGHPVIAGLSSNGGPYPEHYSDHWVVLRGVDSGGGFIINDPWYSGGMNVPLSDHYAGWTIIEARVYQ